MRKALAVLALGLAVAALPRAARAEDGDTAPKKFTITGEVRTRAEWNEHMSDPASDSKDSLTYFPYRVRLGVDASFANNISAHAEVQNFGFFGGDSPSKGAGYSTGFYPESPFTQSVLNTGGNDITQIYQGYITLDKIGGSNFGLRLGRQEHTYNTELLLGDADFYSGVSFDGARGFWTPGKFRVDAFYYRTAQRNFEGAPTAAQDGNLFGATLDYAFDPGLGTVGGYVIVDQRPFFSNVDNSRITSIGAHYTQVPTTDHAFDWNVEVAGQTGTNNGPALPQEIKYSGTVAEGWFGWSFGSSVRSRVHIGGLFASGDDGADPSKNKAFQPLFGDLHAWNRLGDTDLLPLTNVVDFNIGYSASFAQGKHVLAVSGHNFKFDKALGAGLSKNIGNEIDLSYDFNYTKNFAVQVGVADLMRGDFIKDAFAPAGTSDAKRVWAQARLHW